MSTWGKTADGTAVPIYTLTDGQLEVRLSAYGAHLVSIKAPDKTGKMADVILGSDTLQTYIDVPGPYIGAIVGRYGNRIAHGQFTLDGKTYTLPKNNGENTLHGGLKGFDKKVWAAKEVTAKDGQAIELSYLSKDGEEGFPGTSRLPSRTH